MNPCGRVGDSLLNGDILICGVVPKLQILCVGVKASWKDTEQHESLNKKTTPVLNGSFYTDFYLASDLASVKDRNKGKIFNFSYSPFQDSGKCD